MRKEQQSQGPKSDKELALQSSGARALQAKEPVCAKALR